MKHYDDIFVLLFGTAISYPFGGVHCIYNLSGHLASRGHKVGILHINIGTDPLKNAVRRMPFMDAATRAIRKLKGYGYDYSILDNVDMLFDERGVEVDCMFATAWMTAQFVSDYVSAHPKTTGFYFIQNFEDSPLIAGENQKAAAATYRLGNLNKIVNCKGLQDKFKAENPPVLPMAVEPYYKPTTPIESRKPILLAPLKKYPIKGGIYALEAIKRLREAGINCSFIAHGDFAREEVPEYVDYYPSPYNCTLEGFYNKAMVYMHPSLLEGFGSPPIEAMACGCAVVLSDSIGVREYARDGFNCIMVPTRDSKALADGAARLLEDGRLRRRLVRNGLKTAKRFSYSNLYRHFDRIYSETVGKRRVIAQ